MAIIYYNSSVDAFRNLALEELLATEASEPCFLLWRNAPSIIIGRHQNTVAEINGDYVRERAIAVVRRITGGGAVYHDLGNINYSCVSLEATWGPESAAHYTAPIVAALRQLGIDAANAGRNDILANGCKVSGCARSVTRGRTLFHGTLLFDTDLTVLATALRPDPDKIRSKGIKSVRARVGNIRDMLPAGCTMDMDGFIGHLLEAIPAELQSDGISPIPQELLMRAETLAKEKYRTWEWNYGTVLAYDVEKKLRFGGGIIKAHFNVRDNCIGDVHFSGDFFGTLAIDGLTDRLNGCLPRRDVLLQVLADVPVKDYIYGMTSRQLSDLLAID